MSVALQSRRFHEADSGLALSRRAAAEAVGTALLVFSASAGGNAASRLLPGEQRLAILFIAVCVAGGLMSLIVAFGKISGGHFNPLITVLKLLAGERSVKCTFAYVVAQLLGGTAGGVSAAVLWLVAPTLKGGLGFGGFASAFVASAGLMLVVFGSARSGRPDTGPFAVGAWLVAAVLATPTGSYANPAVVLGALVSAGPIALGGPSALPYIAAEIAGAVLALGIISFISPRPTAIT